MLDESHREHTIPILKYNWARIDCMFLKYFKVYQMSLYLRSHKSLQLKEVRAVIPISGAVK